MKVYYLRVSTIEQNTARQMEEVPEGCKVFEDKVSGSVPFSERTEGRNIVNLIKQRQINTIYVHSIDRLGRNSLDILQTIQFFNEYEVNLISKKEGLQTFIDGKPNAIASLMIGILSTLSEFELSRIKERSKEGIAEAKKRGAYANNGGKKKIDNVIKAIEALEKLNKVVYKAPLVNAFNFLLQYDLTTQKLTANANYILGNMRG